MILLKAHKIPNQRIGVVAHSKINTANTAPNNGYVAKMAALTGTPTFSAKLAYQ